MADDVSVIRVLEGPAGEGFRWRGEWDSGTVYVPEDVVRHPDGVWRAVDESVGVEPTDAASEWERLTKDGELTEEFANATYATKDELDNATERLGPQTADLTVQIPTDYGTLQEAVDDLSTLAVEQGVTITLNIETGHSPDSGVMVEHGNYGHVRITSDDAVVTVGASFTGDLIHADNATAPTLACLVDMNDLGDDGYALWNCSTGIIESSAGVRNAGGVTSGTGRGLYATTGCIVVARSAEFTGNNNRNVWITRGSTAELEDANISGSAGGHNIYVSRGSIANLTDADATGAAEDGVVSTRSLVNAHGVNASNAGRDGFHAERGARLICTSGTANDCGRNGLFVENASMCDARALTATGCTGKGVVARGSWVDAGDVNVSNSVEQGVYATSASYIKANGATASGCGMDGIRADDGATVSCRSATAENNSGFDMSVIRGSFINGDNVRTTAGQPNIADCRPSAFNEFDGQDGVIFADNNPD